MQNIFVHDVSFSPWSSICRFHKPTLIEWDRVVSPQDNDIVVFTDLCLDLSKNYRNTRNIALIIEPFAINPNPYNFVIDNIDNFELVLSHHTNFVNTHPKIKYYPNNMRWITPDQYLGNLSKDRWISIIASNKNHTCGHNLRHKVIEKFKDCIDVYGSGYNPIETKLPALGRYKFSIVIENCKEAGYYSEKLLDCFLTKTIPIYFGDPHISDRFKTDGMIMFDKLEDLDSIIKDIKNNSLYNKVGKILEENFNIAKDLPTVEDYIYNQYLKELL
jgi:hypothetical protein